MKKFNIGVMVFIAVFSFANVSCAYLIGNGNIDDFEKNLSSFEKISITQGVNVNFHIGHEYRAVITVDSNLEKYVVLSIKNNILNVGLKNGLSYSFTKLMVDVYCPFITGVSVAGSGYFTSGDKIVTDNFAANISGSGKMEGSIECDTMSIIASGSGEMNSNIVCNKFYAEIGGFGKISITGTGKDANVDIAGSGNFNGIEFQNNTADVHVSGSGNVSIWVLEYLKPNISGSGNVKYRGTPKIDYSGSGSGKIISE
jgi:hypothetical protein